MVLLRVLGEEGLEVTEQADIERLRGLVNESLFKEPVRSSRTAKIDLPESFTRWIAPDAPDVLHLWIAELVRG